MYSTTEENKTVTFSVYDTDRNGAVSSYRGGSTCMFTTSNHGTVVN